MNKHSTSLTVPIVLPSSRFYLAAGTVTVDRAAGKMLCVLDRNDGEVLLPRGRKDWGESLPDNAVRETFEETGFRSKLLPLTFPTRATRPGAAEHDRSHPYHDAYHSSVRDADDDVTIGGAKLIEAFAMMQHIQEKAGQLAVVYWFMASGDSTAEGETDTQMPDENYEPRWLEYETAVKTLTKQMYKDVARLAIEALKYDAAASKKADGEMGKGQVGSQGPREAQATNLNGAVAEARSTTLKTPANRQNSAPAPTRSNGTALTSFPSLDGVIEGLPGPDLGPVLLACPKVGILAAHDREITA